jgi:hypothetical protein
VSSPSPLESADGNGAWIISTDPARLFTRNQAGTDLSLAARLAAGYGEVTGTSLAGAGSWAW